MNGHIEIKEGQLYKSRGGKPVGPLFWDEEMGAFQTDMRMFKWDRCGFARDPFCRIPHFDIVEEWEPKAEVKYDKWELFTGEDLPIDAQVSKFCGSPIAYRIPLKEPSIGDRVKYMAINGQWSVGSYELVDKAGEWYILKKGTMNLAYKEVKL